MWKRSIVVVAVLVFAAVKAQAQEPQWLKDARSREAANLKEQMVRSKDGLFSARLLGTLVNKEIVEEGGSYTVEVDIGSDSTVACEVYLDDIDMAATLQATADATMKVLEKQNGRIEVRAVDRTDAGAFGSMPYIALDWLYRANDGAAAKVGSLKQMALSKNGAGLYCAHAELGFTKTFQTLVRTLAESLQLKDSGPAPYFTEITVLKMRGQKVGVSVTTMSRDVDGDTKYLSITATAVPVTPDTLQTEDETHLQWIQADGTLLNARHASSANGELETDLLLTQSEGKWVVSGEFSGKEIEKTLGASPTPMTFIQEARAKKAVLGRKDAVGATVKTYHWITADPTRVLEAEMTILKAIDADHFAAKETLEGITAEMVVDRATGQPTTVKIQAGPVTMEIERVFVQGSF